ncbi:hypothetical protein GRI75_04230 [Altererythrobacter soli]|uniref:Uncharacterized protein n=1 Tax=Croceibacterium soli TaxID=1739690 RepID=A0A6I4UTB7_9SPHN|nr:hypothetical protein [Croceibacterium soli]MXP40853.1 hypothetical protein [Croceibacterium soli]
MEGDRITRALSRIEAAAARIESAAAQPVRAPTPSPDADLQRKHAALVSEAGAALQDLDRLIGSLER